MHAMSYMDMETWADQALCKTHPKKEWWFPDQSNHLLGEYAKKVCAECSVEEQCLEYALENDEQHGIWGGTTPKQRVRIKKRRASYGQ